MNKQIHNKRDLPFFVQDIKIIKRKYLWHYWLYVKIINCYEYSDNNKLDCDCEISKN